MIRHGENETGYWWEFGKTTDNEEYDLFRKKMGIYPKFDLFMQIRPLNVNYSESLADKKVNSSVPSDNDLVKTERIVYVQKYDQEQKKWVFLKNQKGEIIRYSYLVWAW